MKNVHNKENRCAVLGAGNLVLLAGLVGVYYFIQTVYAISADDFNVLKV